MTKTSGGPDRGLQLIAVFKFVKAVLLIVIGLGALRLIGPEWPARVSEWLGHLASGASREVLQRLLSRLLHLGPRKLLAVAIGAWIYAALFLVEGTGLLLQRRWAEYLTVIVTISFMPFEAYELVRRVTPERIVALVINLVVLVYLVVRLRRRGARNSGS